jgi:alkylated DNA repair protein alkB family protein 8
VISPDVELMEHRRSVTRFLYLENVASSSNVTMAKYPTVARRDASGGDDNIYADDDDDDGDDDISTLSMIKDLMSIFRGAWSPGTDDGCDVDALAMRMIDDDVRHAYQDAMRDAIASAVHTTDDGNEHFDGSGVELFMMPSDAMPSPGKKARGMGPRTNGGCVDDGVCGDGHHHDDGIDRSSSGVYDRMHIGMRDNRDAAMLIRKWQGKRVSLSMRLPVSFVDRYRSVGGVEYFSVNILTGKLFLDYADVFLPKGRHRCGVPRGRDDDVPPPARSTSFGGIGGGVGEPSRPECTSATDHIHIPGLTLIKNYTSEDEERVLMAALSGPHAPWAPAQSTPSGGIIRRRVQHYGYVFDYASADVLRRDDVGVDHEECNDERIEIHSPSACPPMPSICSSGHSASDMADGDLEGYIDRAVRDVRGWEALAGIIERTRRFVFDVSSSCHPHVNQLTVNEYIPGQGIGSHIDTVTAFDDGILIITLNGGIVMEFRKVIDDDTSSRTINPNERSSCKYNSDEPPMKNVQERKLVYLPPRSLMLLSGDARYKWEHMIVSRTTDTVEGVVLPRKLRVSLTLRTALSRQVKKELRHPVIASPLPHYETCVFPPQWGQLSDAAAAAAANTVPPKHNGNENQTTTPGSHSSAGNRSDLVTPATERKHVHTVYDAIATQWHHTRGKRGVLWPGATQFLENLPKGSIVADVGCGDGKYFTAITAASSYVIGTDISEPLLKTAAAATEEGHTTVDGPHYQRLSTEKRALSLRPAVAVADCIHLPLRSQSFDAAICIAVMHHLSTEGRRIRCLAELRRIVKVGGLINVQAWALEQEDDSKRKFHGTDVLVPFNAQPKYLLNKLSDANGECWNFQTTVVDAPSIGKGVAQMVAEKYTGAEFDSKKNLVVFQRYCHMYRRGELEQLCLQVPGLMVLESSYEKGNHVVLLIVT